MIINDTNKLIKGISEMINIIIIHIPGSSFDFQILCIMNIHPMKGTTYSSKIIIKSIFMLFVLMLLSKRFLIFLQIYEIYLKPASLNCKSKSFFNSLSGLSFKAKVLKLFLILLNINSACSINTSYSISPLRILISSETLSSRT